VLNGLFRGMSPHFDDGFVSPSRVQSMIDSVILLGVNGKHLFFPLSFPPDSPPSLLVFTYPRGLTHGPHGRYRDSFLSSGALPFASFNHAN